MAEYPNLGNINDYDITVPLIGGSMRVEVDRRVGTAEPTFTVFVHLENGVVTHIYQIYAHVD